MIGLALLGRPVQRTGAARRSRTAYDTAYVALAEERAVPLVTDDETIVKVAGEIARPLVPR